MANKHIKTADTLAGELATWDAVADKLEGLTLYISENAAYPPRIGKETHGRIKDAVGALKYFLSDLL